MAGLPQEQRPGARSTAWWERRKAPAAVSRHGAASPGGTKTCRSAPTRYAASYVRGWICSRSTQERRFRLI